MNAAIERDYGWQRTLLPCVKRALAEILITEAPFEDDALRNTDLIVLKAEAIRVACRLRRYGYLEKYGGEFTIRSSRPSGCETELGKLISGWGDYLFYGFSNEKGDDLAAWIVGDLRQFRGWYARQLATKGGQLPGSLQVNGDGSSAFTAFRIIDLPAPFVVARYAA